MDECIDHIQEARKDVEATLQLEKEHQKEVFEAGKHAAHTFQVNDYVWLSSKNINIKVPARKLGDTQLGPYKVIQKIGLLDYRLALPLSLARLHPIFHVDKLTPWKGNEVNGILPPPPEPVELEDGLEYEVQDILDSKIVGKGWNHKTAYLVAWKGYNTSDNSWEPLANLANARDAIEEFHTRHPQAPHSA